MAEDLEYHQRRIQMLASQLADSLEYLTATETRNRGAHEAMLRVEEALISASNSFKRESANALAELSKAVEQSPEQLADAVRRLAADTAKEAVGQATKGLMAATSEAAQTARTLKKQVQDQAMVIMVSALGAALIGGFAGALASYYFFKP